MLLSRTKKSPSLLSTTKHHKKYQRDNHHQYTKDQKKQKRTNRNWFRSTVLSLGMVSVVWLVVKYNREKNYYRRDLTGKYVLITGGGSGIGLETAVGLAEMGGFVVIVGRNEKKLAEAAQTIRDRSGSFNVYTLPVDLSDLDSIEEMVAKCDSLGWKFDYLVNNAGVMEIKRKLNKNGHEMNMAVNHLGHYYLTVAMLNKQLLTEKARIVNVSSNAHRRGNLDLDDFSQMNKKYWNIDAYSTSKLSNILFTVELAKKLEEKDSHIQTCSLAPGFVNTNLFSFFPDSLSYIIKPFFYIIAKTPNEGAQTTLHCLLTPDLQNGAYYENCTLTPLTIPNLPTQSSHLWHRSESECKITLLN